MRNSTENSTQGWLPWVIRLAGSNIGTDQVKILANNEIPRGTACFPDDAEARRHATVERRTSIFQFVASSGTRRFGLVLPVPRLGSRKLRPAARGVFRNLGSVSNLP